jgi:PilZ domain-containing protein
MNETQTERRKSRRFRLRLAVVFSWRDEHGALQSGEGYSCDISGRGIYVRTRCAPAAGNSMEMNVFLPQPAYDIRAAEIHAKGQVMRVDQGRRGQVCGFAAMNRSVVIREPIEPAFDERGVEQRPSAPRQRITAKQDAGLRRS